MFIPTSKLFLSGLILLLLTIGSTGCRDRGEKLRPVAESEDTRIHTTWYDGCEYIFFTDPDGSISSLTHKGNCSNPIHRPMAPE